MWTMRSRAPTPTVDNAKALPTAVVFAHMTTASDHQEERSTKTPRAYGADPARVGQIYFGVSPAKWVRFKSALTCSTITDSSVAFAGLGVALVGGFDNVHEPEFGQERSAHRGDRRLQSVGLHHLRGRTGRVSVGQQRSTRPRTRRATVSVHRHLQRAGGEVVRRKGARGVHGQEVLAGRSDGVGRSVQGVGLHELHDVAERRRQLRLRQRLHLQLDL